MQGNQRADPTVDESRHMNISRNINIGFTGTRYGLTPQQSSRLFFLIHEYRTIVDFAHHGCCVGADEEFHEMCRILGFKIWGHPPTDKRWKMTDISSKGFYKLSEANDFKTRDRHIAKAADIVYAAPKTMEPVPRSGTWYTARLAEKYGKKVVFVYPDGSTNE